MKKKRLRNYGAEEIDKKRERKRASERIAVSVNEET